MILDTDTNYLVFCLSNPTSIIHGQETNPRILLMKIHVFALLLLLSGCGATGYVPRGSSGGYSEIMKSPDSFIVNFSGNGCTDGMKVDQYALRRAAELTLQNGYKYFVVKESVDQTSTQDYSKLRYDYGWATTTTEKVVRPAVSLSIKCYKEQPVGSDYFDAQYFLSHNKI
jgi:hypothetical protein